LVNIWIPRQLAVTTNNPIQPRITVIVVDELIHEYMEDAAKNQTKILPIAM